ncbi:MAG: hypothetical protein ACRD0Z_01810 [Acidimicrobiales bacterium]
MLEVRAILFITELINSRLEALRSADDRGDVAEKIVIVGIFVAIALAVGFIVREAVVADATKISKSITGAP